MPTLPVPVLALLLLQGLAGSATARQEGGGSAVPFTPLRFGDPAELAYDEPFFPGAAYDPAVPTPDEVLGQTHGSRVAHHAEILECFRLWAAVSPRVQLEAYATSYEGRELVRCVITSPANLERLEAIRADLGALADPRGLEEAEAERIVRESPAAAWMAYSIHGDELSGADAAVALGYHLTAGLDESVTGLLDEVVVVIDPMMNPDGRERIVAQIEQSFGYVTNVDYASMHRGRWPLGRGNHYLFDLNRDWMPGVHPETRGRWAAVRSFHPQLFVDGHEMGGLDTFLFYPQSPPHNPHLPATLDDWHQVFAAGHGAAFDEYGWGYYTREWADAWYPGYSDAWGSLNGAVGILYEQASTGGQPLRRESGEVLTYRESVHHHAVGSLANLNTLRANREAILRDYLAGRRRNVAADAPGNERVFVFVPGRNPSRERRFLEVLLGQGVEVRRATVEFTGERVAGALGDASDRRTFPAGSYLVAARQPQRPLVRAYLDFDPRMTAAFLELEREDLERTGETRLYDVTGWCLAQAYDLDAAWCELGAVADEPIAEAGAAGSGELRRAADAVEGPAYAWAVDGDDDVAVRFAAQALDLGLAVHLSDEPFSAGGRRFPRASLLLRRHENPPDLEERLAEAVRRLARAGETVVVHGLETGRSPDDGPDLGGGHFTLLRRPRVALVGGPPFSTEEYGHLWHQLDHDLRVPHSLLDAPSFGYYDLRRYNVLVLPPGGGSLVREHAETLRAWVEAGGTLIACASTAAAVASEDLGLSAVRLRRDVLDELDDWRFAALRERATREIAIDEELVWGDAPASADAGNGRPEEPERNGLRDPDAERQDAWMRRFSPTGVLLRGLVDERAWVTAGCGAELPVNARGSNVFLARDPVRTAVRLAEEERLRLSGLVWPEARERLADSAYLCVESVGDGQVILFAATPGFRGIFAGTARLFANAVVYGPGAGASQPVGLDGGR